MILILAELCELNVPHICEVLDHYGTPWFRLNGEDFPLRTRADIDLTGNPCSGTLTDAQGRSVPLADIRAVWARRHGERELNDTLTAGQKQFITKECGYTLAGLYGLLGHSAWMNDYFRETKANNKLYQLAVARSCGLEIPQSIVTQNVETAERFYRELDGAVLCKAISQAGHVPKDDSRGGRLIYANRVEEDAAAEFARVRLAPTLLQGYVDKDYELRVTIVGNRIFAAAIDSQKSERSKIDWRRYDFEHTPYSPYRLPKHIEHALLLLMNRLGLDYGAVDLIRAKDGRYVFLEVNPGGQWGWIENMTGHPITAAIAQWLMARSAHA
jgi:glutathione synthase/RimK-type ligase-like ATP-grasp enzyme